MVRVKYPIKNQDKTSTRVPTLDPTPKPAPEPGPEPAPNTRISPLKLREEFLNKIKNEEKNINEQIFREYFQC